MKLNKYLSLLLAFISLAMLTNQVVAEPAGDIRVAKVSWGWPGFGVYPGDRQVPLKIVFVNGERFIAGISVEADLEGLPMRGGGFEGSPRAIISSSSVPPGGIFEADFFLDVEEDATPGTYRIPITLRYHIVEVESESPVSVNLGNLSMTLPYLDYGPEVSLQFTVEVVIGLSCGTISLGVSQYPSEMRAGEEGYLLVSLRNLGDEPVREVRVEILPIEGGGSVQSTLGSPVEISGFSGGASLQTSGGIALEGRRSFFFPSVDPKSSVCFAIKVRVSEGCPRGIYQVLARISYRRVDGTPVEETSLLQVVVSTPPNVPATVEPDRPHINLIEVETSPNPLKVGEIGELKLTLINLGPGEAFSLTLEFPSPKREEKSPLEGLFGGAGLPYVPSESSQAQEMDLPLKIINGANKLFLGDLKEGENVSLSLVVGIEASETGFLEVPMSLRYKDSLGNEYEELVYVTLMVERSADLVLLVPEASSPPGKEILLRGEVVNMGSGEASGIYIQLVDCEGFRQLAPAVVTKLAPGDREDVSLRLLVEEDVQLGRYELRFRITYRSAFNETSTYSNVVLQVKPPTTSRSSSFSLIGFTAGVLMGTASFLGLLLRKRRRGPYYEPEGFIPEGE